MLLSNYELGNLDATAGLAEILASYLQKGDFVALYGDLGSGKTQFTRCLLRALGFRGEVPSPTFTLVQTYELQDYALSHFDLYRLKGADELDELGWDESLSEHVSIVEWPDRAGNRLPPNRLALTFALKNDERRVCKVEKLGSWKARL